MDHKPWSAVATRVIALSFVLAGLAACDERHATTSSRGPTPSPASPSAVVIGTVPADDTGSAPTATLAGNASGLSKAVEGTSMPLPGQANDHSNLAVAPSQKAGNAEILQNPQAKRAAGS